MTPPSVNSPERPSQPSPNLAGLDELSDADLEHAVGGLARVWLGADLPRSEDLLFRSALPAHPAVS